MSFEEFQNCARLYVIGALEPEELQEFEAARKQYGTKAEDFINNCALVESATSFGGVHSSAERRSKRGDAVPPGFVRLAIGCEPVEELWQAIQASLDRLDA